MESRLKQLRAAMQRHKIDAYIVPSSDPHQSEYVATHWTSRAWISGFTGSAGTVVVTSDHAGVWTDSRYFLQAETELLDTSFELHRLGVPHTAGHLDWLKDNLTEGATIGFDGRCFSQKGVAELQRVLSNKKISLKSDVDLVGSIWSDRPPLPRTSVFELKIDYAGRSRLDKIGEICDMVSEHGCTHHLLTALDDVAWTFNIRGNDVACNPVSIAYAIVSSDESVLFIDEQKVPEPLRKKMQSEGILLRNYDDVQVYLSQLDKNARILVDTHRTNYALYSHIPPSCVLEGSSIPTFLKAQKNKTEIANIRQAMVKDGVALTKLYRWLDATLKKRGVKETELADRLHQLRKEQDNFFGDSFEAIVGYQSNGAIVHYRAMPDTCATIQKEGILLLDSGGQYYEGTTDITRTTALGKPTAQQKKHFTWVLKGHIALAQARFPEGTAGNQLDTLARMFLWQKGLNYGHGTGHGVGYFLNVHEGPQSISPTQGGKSATVLREGMLTSNEPGFYKEGKYGIRIENLILTTKDKKTESGQFLCFETLTLFPIDQKMINKKLLTENEIAWLNAYHFRVEEALCPHLNKEEQAWMRAQCKQIPLR